MPRLLTSLLAVFGGLACVSTVNGDATPSPDRVRYDNQCFIIDGKDTFLYSGSFHYFRCPKPLWADRFQKMKDAGLNCVETYVAWNWHEQQPPASPDDFSKVDMTDLTDWLDMAINRFGFYVILRPGPYICAEWDGGGYPQWLTTKKPAAAPRSWLRGDDPVYLEWCKHWYTAAAKAAAPFQITRMPAGKPGVILWQIENEYNYASLPAEVKLRQLQALAHDSRDLGIDVPLITCMTSDPLFRSDPYLLGNVIECRNTYPRFSPETELRDITVLDSYQPEKPKMITELQGGWFSEVGRELSSQMGYTPQQITHVTLLAWAHGFTGTNYYMMFGGTNLGDWAASGKTTTYDYAAPIREWGGVGPRYFAVQAMADVVKKHGEQLARSIEMDVSADPVPAGISGYMRIAKDGSRFLFIFNDQQDEHARGTLHVSSKAADGVRGNLQYDLDPYDAKILYLPPGVTDPAGGQWLPEPATPPQRPTNLPAAVEIRQVRRQIDPGPPADSWRDLPDNGGVEDAGIFDRRFVYYRASLGAATTPPTFLSARLASQDSFIAQLNGNRLPALRHGRGNITAVIPSTSSDGGQLLLLYENGGRDNGGADMDAKCGLFDLVVGNGKADADSVHPANAIPMHWQISGQTAGTAGKWWDPALDDSKWEDVKLVSTINPGAAAPGNVPVNLVWYRIQFDLPSPEAHVWVPWKLHLQASGNGFIYLNGHALGRYWDAGPQQDFYLPECWMNFGPNSTNVVALCMRPTRDSPTVRRAWVSPYGDFAETR
jgi:hypothetical protein